MKRLNGCVAPAKGFAMAKREKRWCHQCERIVSAEVAIGLFTRTWSCCRCRGTSICPAQTGERWCNACRQYVIVEGPAGISNPWRCAKCRSYEVYWWKWLAPLERGSSHSSPQPQLLTTAIGDGYVYVMINASMPGLVKIGSTSRAPDERAKEISQGTGIATPFLVAYEHRVGSCETAEREIHAELARLRISTQREFFTISVRDAISIVAKIAAKYTATV
jgi:T5orf172 domain-containing protein